MSKLCPKPAGLKLIIPTYTRDKKIKKEKEKMKTNRYPPQTRDAKAQVSFRPMIVSNLKKHVFGFGCGSNSDPIP